ncbi:hypothetical protein OEIGOIKO_05807 [Streptomyces chrestomyceticus JCM 4735]|uniref:Ribbon-helix-helix protein CopG domain-containing protein n=1 Tax=Streptomyces chrestomyceticus JCM 4735 TaxID=1306181 RepID=A0A7U9L054_9ACTN|nr:hypothetical protein [Streptomyces chrestomyceticus]GCD37997.1 hypothetical protein OEIGOIKO_05807 [Streptomyces chrestomyceticus JCM 4735]
MPSERYSITLVPPAVEAVNRLTAATGLSKTDVINRAVQVYGFIEDRIRDGDEVLLRNRDGEIERVHIV